MLISIRENEKTGDEFKAEIQLGHGPPYEVAVRDPFTAEEEERLEWYFEKWLTFPFTSAVLFENLPVPTHAALNEATNRGPSSPCTPMLGPRIKSFIASFTAPR